MAALLTSGSAALLAVSAILGTAGQSIRDGMCFGCLAVAAGELALAMAMRVLSGERSCGHSASISVDSPGTYFTKDCLSGGLGCYPLGTSKQIAVLAVLATSRVGRTS